MSQIPNNYVPDPLQYATYLHERMSEAAVITALTVGRVPPVHSCGQFDSTVGMYVY